MTYAPSVTEAHYLVSEREAELLAAVLAVFDLEQSGDVDRIVCALIDLGLCDAERGPIAQAKWNGWLVGWEAAGGGDLDESELEKAIRAAYLGEE